MKKFEVVFTGDVTDSEHSAIGATRANGWISPNWSMTTLFENKEDVELFYFDTYEEAEKFIEDTLGSCEGSSAPSYYANDGRQDGDDYWSYAGHIEEVEQ